MTEPYADFFHGAVRPAVAGPFGATWDGMGTGFRVWSGHATAITLELRTPDGRAVRVPMAEEDAGIWHVYVPGAGPGTRYGLRADGPFLPAIGHLFNPAKLLLDPYARLIDGPLRWHDSLRGFHRTAAGDLHLDTRDSAADLPWAVVTDPAFDWQGDAAPRVPWRETVIYEAHLKGLTELHPEVPRALRGTYLGLASEPVVAHLKSLGVTAVELLPIHQAADNDHQARHGLTNYWGYATVGFFAPGGALRPSGRRAGGRVPRDGAPTACRRHRGHPRRRLQPHRRGRPGGPHDELPRSRQRLVVPAWRPSHRGNTRTSPAAATRSTCAIPLVHRFVLDSLRYWATEMHVDGFRFDLAPAIARNGHGFDADAPLFRELAADPAFAHVKLIAEPWDLGPDGYQLGQFPAGWAEWNGKYRDAVRRFWRGARRARANSRRA